SFYDVTEKLAIVGGVFSFGFFEELTGSPRNSVLVLGVFFIVGLILLFSLLKTEQNINKNSDFSNR
ncbi:MAG TPA: MFS transporter, partial [Mucilaginibacter sp.]